MKRILLPLLLPLAAAAMEAEDMDPSANAPDELRVASDYFLAARTSGELSATGHVEATSGKIRFFSDKVERTAEGRNDFGSASLTTCTNAADCLHWRLDGHLEYIDRRAVKAHDAWLRLFGVPVFWLPYWYYPLNTDYGFRAMPGYTSKWGGYLLTGYVYDIAGEGSTNRWSLGGSTYADFRTKNGAALGQTVRWSFGTLGKGKLRMYHAWDENRDRYSHHMFDSKHSWANWGSPVGYNRYGLALTHNAEFTERDVLRVRAVYMSDSHFTGDFFERYERMNSVPSNEAWYEHRENGWAGGVSVSGPLNEFFGGVSRLPEAWIAVAPQPVWCLPVNYESRTRAGMLNRDYAKYRDARGPFKYQPGTWADYQTFRADTSHRVTAPFRVFDVLSVVPRAGYRGTWYSDTGSFVDPAKASGNGLFRGIAEAGVQFSARGTRWYGDWFHAIEPYLDYSYQDVSISHEGSGGRIYYFDNSDRSYDWLDQFGFDGRGLPVRWHGLRPGLRNTIRLRDDSGASRPVLDTDLYAAIPFNTTDVGSDGRPRSDKLPNYSRSGDRQVVPGFAIRWNPAKGTSLRARTEFDCQNDKVAYSDVCWTHDVSQRFSWYMSYIGRDHRLWDYGDAEISDWNREKSNLAELGFTHDLCDSLGWSPYCRWDCRRNELDEIGSWFELRTDCLAFRLTLSFEDTFRRVDGSKRDADFRCGFFVYLRAFGADSMENFSRF